MTPQWNSDIITPEEKGSGTQVIGDNQQVQTTLESGQNITIEDGKISASGTLENVQADWTQENSEDPSYIKHKPTLATVATSGDYGDLSNRPDLSVYATTSEVADKADKVSGAVSGNLAGFDSNGNLADSGVAAVNLVHDASYVHTDNNFSDSDVTKLSGIEAGAEVNVQANWSQSDSSADDFVKNKPDLSIYAQSANLATVATSGSYNDLSDKPTIPAAVTVDQTYNASSTNAQSGTAVAGAISTKQDTISDLATIRTGAGLGATAVQPGDLATVATTGAYSDLSGTPTIPSGDQLVPSATSADNGKVLTVDNNGDPSWVTPSAGTVYTAGDGVDITNNVISADVDGTTIGIDSSTKKIKLLSAIPTVDQTYTASSQNAQSGIAVASAISTKQDTISDLATIRSGASAGATAVQPSSLATVATTGSYNDLSGKPTLATVATTGDYDDLLNKPSIPAAVTVDQTYSASSTNAQSGTAVAEAVAAISMDEVPTVTSNDDGKVLKATYENGAGSYDWEYPPTEKNLVAGSNVSITSSGDNVTIAATDTTYTFSTGLTDNSGTITVTNPLPSSTSSDEDKVLTVDSTGAPVWAASQGGGNEVPSVTSNDDGKILKASYSGGTGSYSWQADAKKPVVAGTGISITNNTNDVTIAATTPVPAVTSSDDGKVLTATYSGGVGSYAWAAAQGGTTYTAGDGIDISNDTISADVDGTTIGIDSTTKKIKLLSAIPTVDQTYNSSSTNAQSGVAVASAISTAIGPIETALSNL